jgi:hypothetical protein
MPKYVKKPVVIEAIQWKGYLTNEQEIREFVGEALVDPYDTKQFLLIKTLEGDMQANPGDWIIKGIRGEFYPCKPDIFEATYDPVE